MENGGRERDRGSESDEDEDSEQNTSDTGRLEDGSYPQNTARGHEQPFKIGSFVFSFFLFLGPGWTANFRDSRGTAASQTPAGWDSSAGGGAATQGTGWANFTEFQPFSG